MYEDKLKKLDYTEKEIQVYSALLEIGKSTPADIARTTGINRSSVYHVLDSLQDKGVVVKDISEKTTYVTPRSPEAILEPVKQKEKEVKRQKSLAQEAIDDLKKIERHTEHSVPKIQFIEEKDISEELHRLSPKWNKSMLETDQTIWGFQDHCLVENYSEWISWYWENKPKEIEQKMFSNDAEAEQEIEGEKYEDRAVRAWSGETDFTASVWVTGDYITLMKCNRRPFYMVVINDSVMAYNLREYFKQTWKEM